VTIEIRDAAGALVRRYQLDRRLRKARPIALPPTLNIGLVHRRDSPPARACTASHGICAIRRPGGIHALTADLGYLSPYSLGAGGSARSPGEYSVTLTVDGKSQTTRLILKMDPRVSTPAEGLAQQFRLSIEASQALAETHHRGLKLADRIIASTRTTDTRPGQSTRSSDTEGSTIESAPPRPASHPSQYASGGRCRSDFTGSIRCRPAARRFAKWKSSSPGPYHQSDHLTVVSGFRPTAGRKKNCALIDEQTFMLIYFAFSFVFI
jgi:hypothetical protein